MSHLSSERLAELADSDPTVAEAEHLAACATCAAERRAHRRLLTLAGDERGREASPLTDWATLSARLRAEKLITTKASDTAVVDAAVIPLHSQPRPHRRAWLAGLRVAAGLVIATTFGALGRISAGADATPTGQELAATAKLVVGAGGDRIVPSILPETERPFTSVEEALASLSSAQREYDRAVGFIAAHDSTVQSPHADEVYRTRLAALDAMAQTSLQALSAAPADPVLNQYYLSTIGAREVTLRQLGTALTPGGKRVVRF
jgi:hypothetical protein